jgi:hypothetical protein
MAEIERQNIDQTNSVGDTNDGVVTNKPDSTALINPTTLESVSSNDDDKTPQKVASLDIKRAEQEAKEAINKAAEKIRALGLAASVNLGKELYEFDNAFDSIPKPLPPQPPPPPPSSAPHEPELAIGRLGRPPAHPILAEESQGAARPNRVG